MMSKLLQCVWFRVKWGIIINLCIWVPFILANPNIDHCVKQAGSTVICYTK